MFSAPNFTCTPNIFFDEIIQTLNEGELRVILIIIRQTLGWGKKSDWMTYTLLAKKTGYERRAVIAILGRLVQKNLVSKTVTGNSGFQKCHFSLAIAKPKKEDEKEDEKEGEDIETEEERELFEKSLNELSKEINTGDRTNTPYKSKKIITSVQPSTPPVFDGTPNKRNSNKRNSNKIVCYRGRCRGVGRKRREGKLFP